LRREEVLTVDILLGWIIVLVIILLQSGQTGATVVSGSPTTLFVTVVLTSTRGEEAFLSLARQFSPAWRMTEVHIPTCSAFSTLRRIFEALSGSGKSSSSPARGCDPV
jgi:hypothetical protein